MRTARLSAGLLLAACALGGAVRADELGTLFYSPEERARMDQLRRGDVTPARAEGAEPQKTVPARPPVLTGYVQRSDGRDTVWIDGRPLVTTSPQARSLEPSKVGRDMPGGLRGERKDHR